jgi:spore coat-associated protein N
MDQYSTEFAQAYVPARRKRRRMLVAMLLASSLATVGAGAMSLAVFTDSQASSGSWTTGKIILGVSPATAFTVTNVMPGDTGAAVIGVTNNGTSQLRYAMTTATTNADAKGLAAQMTLAITTGPLVSGACTGTSIYSGTLAAAALGDPTTGAQAGDRNVNASATDNLCFQWTFPKVSGNAFQNATTTATFNFAAEQTANNP